VISMRESARAIDASPGVSGYNIVALEFTKLQVNHAVAEVSAVLAEDADHALLHVNDRERAAPR